MYFALAWPGAVALGMALLAWILSHTTSTFKGLRTTIWMFATVGLYTFGASLISNLFMPYPCYSAEGDESKSIAINRMLHDPGADCYSDVHLMVLTAVGLFIYGGAIVYVLGLSFWHRRDIILHPDEYEVDLVESTYAAYGFL